MAMQSVYLKEHEGNAHNFVGPLSSAASAPWWSAFGSQSVHGESCDQVKPFSLEIPNCIDQLAACKPSARGAEQVLGKGHTTQFTIFPGILFGFGLDVFLSSSVVQFSYMCFHQCVCESTKYY